MPSDPIHGPLKRVLVVDDEENIRHLLLVVLKKAGYEPTAVAGGEEALRLLGQKDFGIVISDIRMPGMDGRALLEEVAAIQGRAPYVVMMSAYGGDDVAIDCMKGGAYDYFNKPFKADEVVLLLRKIQEREVLFRENLRLREELAERRRYASIIARSKEMEEILATVAKIAPYPTTVLITGESGTGKELLAQAVHSGSSRAAGPMVPVNCGAIPENLLESELFGHAKGAFTGAHKTTAGLFHEADDGSLFLDEVAELPLGLQVKLLRVLEDGSIRRVGENQSEQVDVRLIAATSRDLDALVREGRFREDLYYRLKVLHIRIPPLRRRKEDIPALIESFLARFSVRFGKDLVEVEPRAMELLLGHDWPGNVRELENVIERAVILSDGSSVTVDALPPEVTSRTRGLSKSDSNDLNIKRRVPRLEAELIARALEETDGNRTQACKLLGISHRALLYKMKDYSIDIPSGRGRR